MLLPRIEAIELPNTVLNLMINGLRGVDEIELLSRLTAMPHMLIALRLIVTDCS